MACESLKKFMFWFWVAIWTSALVYFLAYTTNTDSVLSKYANQIFVCSAVIFIFFCASHISSIVELENSAERNFYNNPDLEYMDVTKKCLWIINENPVSTAFRNVIVFGYFHPTYSIIASLGVVCTLTSIPFYLLPLFAVDADHCKEDLTRTAEHLLATGAFLIFCVSNLANESALYRRNLDLLKYRPFDKVIHVPVNIWGWKFALAYVTGGYLQIVLFFTGLAFFFCSFYALHSVSRRTKVDSRDPFDIPRFGKAIHLTKLLGIPSICGIFMWARVLISNYQLAKSSLLVTMERNWQLNLAAYQIILQDETPRSLQELRDLLRRKKKSAMTALEKRLFAFTSIPLWMSKGPSLQ